MLQPSYLELARNIHNSHPSFQRKCEINHQPMNQISLHPHCCKYLCKQVKTINPFYANENYTRLLIIFTGEFDQPDKKIMRGERTEGRAEGKTQERCHQQHRSRKRNKSMMVMATYAVGVAVGEFFFGSFADVDNFNFKRQLFSGEGVVAVDVDIEFTHF